VHLQPAAAQVPGDGAGAAAPDGHGRTGLNPPALAVPGLVGVEGVPQPAGLLLQAGGIGDSANCPRPLLCPVLVCRAGNTADRASVCVRRSHSSRNG
jgi:hypothetical protein